MAAAPRTVVSSVSQKISHSVQSNTHPKATTRSDTPAVLALSSAATQQTNLALAPWPARVAPTQLQPSKHPRHRVQPGVTATTTEPVTPPATTPKHTTQPQFTATKAVPAPPNNHPNPRQEAPLHPPAPRETSLSQQGPKQHTTAQHQAKTNHTFQHGKSRYQRV